MKLLLGAVLCLTLIASPKISYGDAPETVRIEKVYAPLSYTNTDDVQVVITGTISPCVHLGKTEVEIDRAGYLKLTQTGIQQPLSYCADPLMPYQKVVQLGKMAVGTYYIGGEGLPAAPVLITNSVSTDAYPSVTSVEIVSPTSLRLKGFYYSPCATMDHIDVAYQMDRDVISVNPIVKKCTGYIDPLKIPFSEDVSLDPANVPKGGVLIHVRTNNGFLDTVQDL